MQFPEGKIPDFKMDTKRAILVMAMCSLFPCMLAFGIPKSQSETLLDAQAEIASETETQEDKVAAKKQAETEAKLRYLQAYSPDQEIGDNYKKIGFTYSEDMYKQFTGSDLLPENWQAQMETMLAEIQTEENAYVEEENTDDGATKQEWKPYNALDAQLYQTTISSTEQLPQALSAVRAAHKRLGYPYSQPRRDSGIAYDCSSLVYWAYRDAGVNIDPVNCHTAASIAQYMDETGRSVTGGELKAGDLIFYSYKQNGRYKNISHVAMVGDNGMLVQASSTLGRVVVSELSLNKSVAIARPVWEDDGSYVDKTATESEAMAENEIALTSEVTGEAVPEEERTDENYGPAFTTTESATEETTSETEAETETIAAAEPETQAEESQDTQASESTEAETQPQQ